MTRIDLDDLPALVPHTRRTFVRLAALAVGVGLLESIVGPRDALALGQTDVLLLSCMDYRLMDEIDKYMASRNLRDQYDHVILAGASLGALTTKYPEWGKTFWEHLDIAISLHHIHKVMVLDHRDCGAYKVILGEDFAANPAKETAVHTQELRALAKQIHEKYPALEVELLLMSLDGSVEPVSAG